MPCNTICRKPADVSSETAVKNFIFCDVMPCSPSKDKQYSEAKYRPFEVGKVLYVCLKVKLSL
jgi:hypothetical protein